MTTTGGVCHIALLGSCVSRDTIEFADPGSYELVDFLACQSLAAAFAPKRPEWRSNALSGLSSPWQVRSAKRDLHGSYRELLRSAAERADVIVMDLVDERGGVAVLPDGSSFTRSLEVVNSGLLDTLPATRVLPFGSDEHFDRWCAGMDALLDVLRDEGAQDRLVVLDHLWATTSQDGKDAPFGGSKLDPSRINTMLGRYMDFVRGRDIDTLHVPDALCVASSDHRWGLAPFHYADEFYRYVVRRLESYGVRLKEAEPMSDLPATDLRAGAATVRLHGADAADHIFQQVTSTGDFYEAEMLRASASWVRPGDCVVDVGANIGNHSLFWAAECGAEVMAFEPLPACLVALHENVRVNALEGQVLIRSYALGATESRAVISHSPDGNLGATRLVTDRDGEIAVRPLDMVLRSRARPVRLLKVDVEGFEDEVLLGAADVLARDRPILLVECQDDEAYSSVSRIVAQHGYRMREVFNATPTYVFVPDDFAYDSSYDAVAYLGDVAARISRTRNRDATRQQLLARRVGRLEAQLKAEREARAATGLDPAPDQTR